MEQRQLQDWRETFKFWDLVRFISEIWRQVNTTAANALAPWVICSHSINYVS